MIDHLGIEVGDLARARAFYLAALAPLGYEVVYDFEAPDGGKYCGLGAGGKPDFWLGATGGQKATPVHIAFAAADRAQVRAFYDAAIKAGAADNGKPGLREHYHPHYYGAFVRDADGNNIEAVCHEPE
jgi:catechol 2,3-dioxygenase-like lactoylglutathione lyase family enzyme